MKISQNILLQPVDDIHDLLSCLTGSLFCDDVLLLLARILSFNFFFTVAEELSPLVLGSLSIQQQQIIYVHHNCKNIHKCLYFTTDTHNCCISTAEDDHAIQNMR